LGEALHSKTRKGFAFFFFFNSYFLKALLYAKALKKKSTLMGAFLFCFVDNFIEISNISFTPRDLINTHHIMTRIMKS